MDDLISRQAAIDALAKNMPSLTTPDGCGQFDHDIYVTDEAYVDCMQIIHDMPSAQTEPYTDVLKAEIKRMKRSFTICINSDYYTGYMSALSAVEGYIAQMEVTT